MNCSIFNELNGYVPAEMFETALTAIMLILIAMIVVFGIEKKHTPILPNNIHDECIGGSSPIRNRFAKRSASQGELLVEV
jgi:hypothetical protein